MDANFHFKRGLFGPSTSGGTPSKQSKTGSVYESDRFSHLVSSRDALKSTALLPPVTKFSTTNRLLQGHQTFTSTSDYLTEASKRREELFSKILAEKPDLANRILSGSTISRLDMKFPSSNLQWCRKQTAQASLYVYKSRPTILKPPLNLNSESDSISSTITPEKSAKMDLGTIDVIETSESSQDFIIEFAEHEEDLSENIWKRGSLYEDTDHYKLLLLKEQLVFEASISLVGNPKLEDGGDETRTHLLNLAELISELDPEFVLKVALYCRQELNLRSTSNLLLAYASVNKYCKIFLHRYFRTAIVLPTDWMAVADFIKTFEQLPVGSLPAILRRLMVEKFSDFDEYQLAKHNKVKKKKKTPAAPTQVTEEESMEVAMEVETDVHVGGEEDEDARHNEAMRGRAFTLKRLIRVLHINEPVSNVLCLLGKKYPQTSTEFISIRMPGTFDPLMAGKRMKLPVPQTWETQISKHGNKAEVWHELIDNKKLPYMATIRNLRNLVLAGIDDNHVQKVCKFITNEKSVAKSRLFPFRFFTAYKVLDDLKILFLKRLKVVSKGKRPDHTVNVQKKITEKIMRKQKQMNCNAVMSFYKALDQAVAIATVKNIPPISGVTVIIACSGDEMRMKMGERSLAAKSLSRSSTILESALLLTLMIESSAESAETWFYDSVSFEPLPEEERTPLGSASKSLLSRVSYASRELHYHISQSSAASTILKPDLLNPGLLMKYLREEKWIDTLVWIHGTSSISEAAAIEDWTEEYRKLINPSLCFLTVDVDGSGSRKDFERATRHPKNIRLSGLSESIFQCLSSSGSQVDLVENIDKKYKLPLSSNIKENQSLPDPYSDLKLNAVEWKRIRVFISSTFLDMHGERDVLNRFVFPELSRRCHQMGIEVLPVDLRWGVPHFDTRSSDSELAVVRQVRACIDEIDRCHFFVGFLGQRYGWKPDLQNLATSRNIEARYLHDKIGHIYQPGMSITEIEMRYSALMSKELDSKRDRVFFFLRDSSQILTTVPQKFSSHFKSESDEDLKKLDDLKDEILKSGFEVCNNYPASFRGVVGGLPMAGDLTPVGQRVLDILWNSMKKMTVENSKQSDREKIEAFCAHQAVGFVSRKKLFESMMKSIDSCNGGVIILSGAPGIGITSLLCKLYDTLNRKSKVIAIPCFAHLLLENEDVQEDIVPEFLYKELMISLGIADSEAVEKMNRRCVCTNVANLLMSAGELTQESNKRLVLIVDGLEDLSVNTTFTSMTKTFEALEWLPASVPKGVVVVVSTHFGSTLERFFSRRKDLNYHAKVPNLDLSEKKEILRSFLSRHGKVLDERAFSNELSLLSGKKQSGNVRYLQLLVDELSKFGNFDELNRHLCEAGETTSELLKQVLKRLEREIGSVMISSLLAIVFVSRPYGGISEVYLKKCLKRLSIETINDEESASSLTLSVILNGLDAFLQPTKGSLSEGLILLKSREYSDCVEDLYLKSEGALLTQTHNLMASVFQDIFHDQHETGIIDPLVLRAVAHHLSFSSRSKELEELLCNLDFIFHSALTGSLSWTRSHLGGDYLSSKAIRSRFLSSAKVKAYNDFLQKYEDELQRQPCLTLQLALNDEPSSLVRHGAEQLLTSRAACPLLLQSLEFILKWENKHESYERIPILRRKMNSNSTLTSSAVECSQMINDENLLSAHGFSDGSILVSLARTGDELFSLLGHSSAVTALTFASGSTASGDAFLVSGSHDGILSFWDLNSRIRLSSVKGHTRRVAGLTVSQDGLTIVSVGHDAVIKVWGGRTRQEKTEMRQNSPFTCVGHHPEKDFVVTGDFEGLVKIWDLTKVEKKAVLRGHTSSVQCVRISKDARSIASSSINGEVIVFDGNCGAKKSFYRAKDSVFSLSFSTHEEGTLLLGNRNGRIDKWNYDQISLKLKFPFASDRKITSICIDQKLKPVFAFETGEVLRAAVMERDSKLVKMCDEPIESVQVVCHDQPRWGLFSKEVLLVTTAKRVLFAIHSEKNPLEIKKLAELTGFDGRVIGSTKMGGFIVTATSKGNLYCHPQQLDDENSAFFHKVPKCYEISTGDNITAFAAYLAKLWLMVVSGKEFKIFVFSPSNLKMQQILNLPLPEATVSTSFLVVHEKIHIASATDSGLEIYRVRESSDNLELLHTLDWETEKGPASILKSGGAIDETFATLHQSGIAIRSVSGAELRWIPGDFGKGTTICKSGSSRLLVAFDIYSNEANMYDVTTGFLDKNFQFMSSIGSVSLVSYLYNDRIIFASSNDGIQSLWTNPGQAHVDDENRAACPSSPVIAMTSVADLVFLLSEDGSLMRWSSSEPASWKKKQVLKIKCRNQLGEEKMSSLSSVSLGNVQRRPAILLVATCSKHGLVHLILHSEEKTAPIKILQEERIVDVMMEQSPPMCSTIAVSNRNESQTLVRIAIGLESGSYEEKRFLVKKKNLFGDKLLRNFELQVDSLRCLSHAGLTRRCNFVWFKKSIVNESDIGFGGRGKAEGGINDQSWHTCWAELRRGKEVYEVCGDISGQLKVFTRKNEDLKVILVEALHTEAVVALEVVFENVIVSAAKDGFVKVWKLCCREKNSLSLRQIGEFSGRGLPILALTSAEVVPASAGRKNQQVERRIFASDNQGVYVLGMLSTK